MQSAAEAVESKGVHCLLCAVGAPQDPDHAELGEAGTIPLESGDAVVLLARGQHHVEVVPVAHVSQLTALPRNEMAHVLAALRRVTLSQRPKSGTVHLSAVNQYGSSGHVSICVGPTSDCGTRDRDEGGASVTTSPRSARQ